jgi:DNA-binding transcriptional ArsR family regulator
MSRHLRLLRASGLVEVEAEQIDHDARMRVYRLRPEPFVTLYAWLDHVQSFWNEQLGAFKAYAERAQKGAPQ